MIKLIKTTWSDPVWSKVISAGIVAVLGFAVVWLGGLWPSVKAGWSWLWRETPTSNWLLVVMGSATAALLVYLGMKLISFLRPAGERPFVTVYEKHMSVMWKLKASSLSWWVERDLEQYVDADEWIIGPYHRRNGCMEQLTVTPRRSYAGAGPVEPRVPLECPSCGEQVYNSESGKTFTVNDLKLYTLKTIQRLHHQGTKIKDGLEFNLLLVD
jgi:hypothetical protein